MWKKLILLVFLMTVLEEIAARQAPRRRNIAVLQPMQTTTFFDHAYPITVNRGSASGMWKLSKANAAAPTQRPIIRYWNNLLRNVRLSMPTITWNITNPFTNLFNGGEPNIIETPVGGHYDYVEDDFVDTDSVKRRRKSHRKQHHKHAKKHNRLPEHFQFADDDANNAMEEQIDVGAMEEEALHQQQAQSPYLLRPYEISEDPKKAVLFFDPNTGQYYEVQSVRSQSAVIPVRTQQAPPEEMPTVSDVIDEPEAVVPDSDHKLEDIKGTLPAAPLEETNSDTKALKEPKDAKTDAKVAAPAQKVVIPPAKLVDIGGKTRSGIGLYPQAVKSRSQEARKRKQSLQKSKHGISALGRDAGEVGGTKAHKAKPQKTQWYFFVPHF